MLAHLAAFDYDFGATDDHENELGKVYQNMLFVLYFLISRFNLSIVNGIG